MKMKTCSNCNIEFPATTDHFYRQKGGKYGLRKICIECKKQQDKNYTVNNYEELKVKWREYNANNREKINKANRTYYANHNEKIKARRKEQRDSLPKYKHKQKSIKMKKYYEANKERLKENARRYRRTENGRIVELKAKHRRKAREKEVLDTFTEAEWQQCMKHFEYKCAYCGEETEVLHQEHFIPLSKGGEYTKQNIIPSCQECNFRKHTSLFGDWYPNYKYYDKQRENEILSYLGYENKYQQLSIL